MVTGDDVGTSKLDRNALWDTRCGPFSLVPLPPSSNLESTSAVQPHGVVVLLMASVTFQSRLHVLVAPLTGSAAMCNPLSTQSISLNVRTRSTPSTLSDSSFYAISDILPESRGTYVIFNTLNGICGVLRLHRTTRKARLLKSVRTQIQS